MGKKIYFYKLELNDTKTKISYALEVLKQSIIEVIDANATDLGSYKTLDLSIGTDTTMHTMMDVFSYKGDALFCRLSKQKHNNSMLKRNYATRKCSDVLTMPERANNGIEIYTYGMIDYSLGVYAYVKAQSAPDEKIIGNIFTKYNNKYNVDMISIPNKEAINAVYFGNDPKISKIEIQVPVPGADVLQKIFGWNDDEILDAVGKNSIGATITISAPKYGRLVEDEQARGVIDSLRNFKQRFRKIKLTAKAEEIKSKEYDLSEKYFSYEVNITKEHMVDGQRIEYNASEITEIYRKKLREAFGENKDILTSLVNIK